MTLLQGTEQPYDYSPDGALTISPRERIAELEFRGMSTADAMIEVNGGSEPAQYIIEQQEREDAARANIQQVIIDQKL